MRFDAGKTAALSLMALENDRDERLIEGYLPTFGIALPNEVLKSIKAYRPSLKRC